MREVIVKINKKTHERIVEVNGVEGGSCLDITSKFFENEDVETEMKEEAYEQELPDYIENMTDE